jgi:hypothetical protein
MGNLAKCQKNPNGSHALQFFFQKLATGRDFYGEWFVLWWQTTHSINDPRPMQYQIIITIRIKCAGCPAMCQHHLKQQMASIITSKWPTCPVCPTQSGGKPNYSNLASNAPKP